MKAIKPKIINRYEAVSKPSKEPIKKYPNINIDLDTLPEAKDWKINKEYEVTFKLKMTGLSVRKTNKEEMFDSYGNNAQFDIVGVEAPESEDSESDTTDD